MNTTIFTHRHSRPSLETESPARVAALAVAALSKTTIASNNVATTPGYRRHHHHHHQSYPKQRLQEQYHANKTQEGFLLPPPPPPPLPTHFHAQPSSQDVLHRRAFWKGQIQIHYTDLMSLLDDLHQDVLTTTTTTAATTTNNNSKNTSTTTTTKTELVASASPHKVLLIKAIRIVAHAMFQAAESALDPRPPPPPVSSFDSRETEHDPDENEQQQQQQQHPTATSTVAEEFKGNEHSHDQETKFAATGEAVVTRRSLTAPTSVPPQQPDPDHPRFMGRIGSGDATSNKDQHHPTSTDEDDEEVRFLLDQHPPSANGTYTPSELVALFSKVFHRPRLLPALKAYLFFHRLVPGGVTADDMARIWCSCKGDPTNAPLSWTTAASTTRKTRAEATMKRTRTPSKVQELESNEPNDTTTTEDDDEEEDNKKAEDESEDGAHALLSLHKSLSLQPPSPAPPTQATTKTTPSTATLKQRGGPKKSASNYDEEQDDDGEDDLDRETNPDFDGKIKAARVLPIQQRALSRGSDGIVSSAVAAMDDNRLYFSKEEVIGNPSFFWIGRGGYAITHPGNNWVRSVIASKTAEYLQLKRSQRGSIGRSLLKNELSNVKFVISRDAVLRSLEADDQSTVCKALGSSNPAATAALKPTRTRRIGASRRKSLLKKHVSVEQIRSYPPETCIEVGFAWSLDILSHQLREDVTATTTSNTATTDPSTATRNGSNKSPTTAREDEEDESDKEETKKDYESKKDEYSSPLLLQPSFPKTYMTAPPVAGPPTRSDSEHAALPPLGQAANRPYAELEAQRLVEAIPPMNGERCQYTPREMVALFLTEGRKQVRVALKTYLVENDLVPLHSASSVGHVLRQYSHQNPTTVPLAWQQYTEPFSAAADNSGAEEEEEEHRLFRARPAEPAATANYEGETSEGTEDEPNPKRVKTNDSVSVSSSSSSSHGGIAGRMMHSIGGTTTNRSSKPAPATSTALPDKNMTKALSRPQKRRKDDREKRI